MFFKKLHCASRSAQVSAVIVCIKADCFFRAAEMCFVAIRLAGIH